MVPNLIVLDFLGRLGHAPAAADVPVLASIEACGIQVQAFHDEENFL
jgi:hypothetical protein